MSGRAIAVVALVAVGAIVVGLFAMRPDDQQAAPSPTPTASPTGTPTQTPSLSPTPTATATATTSPTASPGSGRYVNALAGYSIEVTPPWRRSGCFSAVFGEGADAIPTDVFLTVREYDEGSGHTGLPHAYVEIHTEPDPEGLTPRQWNERRGDQFAGQQLTDTTFAGEPALRVVGGDRDRYVVGHGTRMFEIMSVAGRDRLGDENTAEQRAALIATFRFLSPAELAAARAAPTPSPQPARSFEQVAQTLADGFARRDVALLMSVVDRPCMNVGVAQGGGSALSTAKFMDELRTRFARGLTVTVRPTEYDSAPGLDNPTRGVESTWKEPGQQDLEVDLFVTPTGDRWHWTGVLYYFVGRQ